jgi:hypothetical protein
MRRREFLGAAAATLVGTSEGRNVGREVSGSSVPPFRHAADFLLIPMDNRQSDHLKAYGVAYRALQRGAAGEWLLNYRAGSFLLPADSALQRDAALRGVTLETLSGADLLNVRGEIHANNMDSIPLEKAPKVAVYAPPAAAPWDDAVTMALQYAGIEYDTLWDPEVIAGRLAEYEWLHLHHEDFTGQYSKFYLTYSGTAWLARIVRENVQLSRTLGFDSVAALKKGVARYIRGFVEEGGFLFAMCTATETLEIALAAEGVDVAAQYSDGTPMDSQASAQLNWNRTFAFRDVELERSAAIASFSNIDGHQVNNPGRRQPLGAFQLFNFSAKIDPVPTMLVQCHRNVISDFYGLTTSFSRSTLKPGVTVLGEEPGATWVKYIHGDFGDGTWTFLGGHDPEDPQHQIGDPPTDLSLYPNSPGYRLILNNVLFPAAQKRELKT